MHVPGLRDLVTESAGVSRYNILANQPTGVFSMQYLISFLEGIITFVSPCLLPMLPVYIS